MRSAKLGGFANYKTHISLVNVTCGRDKLKTGSTVRLLRLDNSVFVVHFLFDILLLNLKKKLSQKFNQCHKFQLTW